MNQLLIFKVFVNMKKNLFLVAMAAVVFAACSDDFADAPPVVTPTNEEAFEKPILFSSASSSITRADYTGAAAAEKLGDKFVVSGYKGSSTSSIGSMVFDNFLVEWTENTANTTESNTSNWEYVGKGPIDHATAKGITRQTIKYWDYTQTQYDFIAWSTGTIDAIYSGTPNDGEVLVSEITPDKAFGTYDPTSTTNPVAYTFTGKAADLSQCYVSDLVTVKKYAADKGTYGDKGSYGEPVVLTFRSLGTKVRIGIYETVPGYSVKDVKFYPKAGALDAATDITTNAQIFTTIANDVYTEGTYTVYFPTVNTPANTDNNQAHIYFSGSGTQSTIVDWGTMNYTIAEDAEKSEGAVFLGRSSNTASFAGNAATNYYEYYLPNENGTNFNLRVDFTLESIDGTGELIYVKNASAQIPLIYTQWKPGYAYTYLFKISDKTNGKTGKYDPTKPDDDPYNADPEDLAGLYPITFDAVVVDAEDNGHTQETITTITTPSITTYQQGSTVVDKDEYTVNGKDIYVSVNENDALVNLTGKAALYTLSCADPTVTFTEASVVDAMSMREDLPGTVDILGRNKLGLTTASSTITGTVVSGPDGNDIDLDPKTTTDDEALSFTPESGKTYAFVYTQTAPTATTEKFQPVTKAAGTSVAGLYRYGLKNAPAGDVQEGVLYFLNKTSGKQTVFLGQKVDNLYILDGTDYTIASGYAKTGTTYFYTTDNGMTYTAASVVAYDDFSGADLYIDATATTPKGTETSPIDGQAYYTSAGVYCVIYPQRTNGTQKLMIQNTTAAKVACTSGEIAYDGMSYFDKYIWNDGVYYAKIIKVE